MASVRDDLKTVWQIRYYDSRRSPKETTHSLPKGEYTRVQAESEAESRQQLYDRSEYNPGQNRSLTPPHARARTQCYRSWQSFTSRRSAARATAARLSVGSEHIGQLLGVQLPLFFITYFDFRYAW